jgi:hypothetical protein
LELPWKELAFVSGFPLNRVANSKMPHMAIDLGQWRYDQFSYLEKQRLWHPSEMSTERDQICAITRVHLPRSRLISLELVGGQIGEKIRKDYPDLKLDAVIDRVVVSRYRTKFGEELLKQERGDLTDLDRQVAQSLASGVLISERGDSISRQWNFGESASDALALLGGSWTFLFVFAGGI